jgi:hypothetical protein
MFNSIVMLAGRLGNSLGMVSAPLALAYVECQSHVHCHLDGDP